MKKKVFIVAIVTVILVLGLSMFTSNPIVSCNIELPEGYLEAIEKQSEGLYSNKIPLVPIYTTVDSFIDGKVFYSIHYFPIGTVGMSYTAYDGYNIEKPLTNQ